VTEARTFRLVHQQARSGALVAIKDAPEGWTVKISPPTRSLDANAAMWPILDAFSKQLEWPVNGRMVKMPPDDWKAVLSAAFKRESAQIAMGLDGGVVMLGMRTSKMPKAQFSEFLEFLHATAADRNVIVYPEPNQGVM